MKSTLSSNSWRILIGKLKLQKSEQEEAETASEWGPGSELVDDSGIIKGKKQAEDGEGIEESTVCFHFRFFLTVDQNNFCNKMPLESHFRLPF